jgi:ABC-type branched-subunit amino acid transport system substrate-binding protein
MRWTRQGFWDAWRDWGEPLHGVIGARCSSASMAIAQIAGLDHVPQISMSSTSASLSNMAAYPYFFRTVAPDNEHGLVGAMVQMLAAFGWRHVSLMQTGASYSNTLATEFHKSWKSETDRSIGYSHTITTSSSSEPLNVDQLQAALDGVPVDDPSVNSRVIVLVAHQHHAFQILEMAAGPRYRGAFSDTIFVHSLPPYDYTPTGSGVDKPAWMPAIPGYLGILPLASTNAARALYMDKLHDWEDSQGFPRSIRLPAYVAETVDAVVSLAKALDPLSVEQRMNGSLVREQLQEVVFEGVSGTVAFTREGDRADPRYTVVNLGTARRADGVGSEWTIVGSIGTSAGTADIKLTDVCWASVGCGLAKPPSDRYPPIRTNVTLGLLFATGGLEADRSADEYLRQAGAELAIAHVNEDDSILPDVLLLPAMVDTSLIRTADNLEQKTSAAEAINWRLSQVDAAAVVGATWSSDVVALSPSLNLPVLSPSASAARLSNTTNYPLFSRLCLPDSRQAKALADTVCFFDWSRVGMVYCDDVYCKELAAGTRAELQLLGKALEWEHEVSHENTDVDVATAYIESQLNNCAGVAAGEEAVIILILHDAEPLLGGALDAGLHVTWLAAEAIGSADPGRNTVASNILALRPGGIDLQFARYQALVAALPEAATSIFALMAYDGVFALARAMHAVITGGGDVYNATAVMLSLQAVSFEGASGDVRFDDKLDRVGSFDIVKTKGSDQFENVGAWDGNTRVVTTSELLQFSQHDHCAEAEDNFSLLIVGCIVSGVLLAGSVTTVVVRRSRRKGAEFDRIRAERARRIASASDGHFTTFISHSKDDGGAIAQTLHTKFDEHLLKDTDGLPTDRGPNFIDTVNLDKLTTQAMVDAVTQSKVMVLILTRQLLTRTFCLLEIYTAIENDVPIVPVQIVRQREQDTYSYGAAADFLKNLTVKAFDKEYMSDNFGVAAWSRYAWDEIQSSCHTKNGEPLTLQRVQEVLSVNLPTLAAEEYKPNANPKIIGTQVEVIVTKIEEALTDQEHFDQRLTSTQIEDRETMKDGEALDRQKQLEHELTGHEKYLVYELEAYKNRMLDAQGKVHDAIKTEQQQQLASVSSLTMIALAKCVPFIPHGDAGLTAQASKLMQSLVEWFAAGTLLSKPGC